MKKYFALLKTVSLFRDIDENEIESMLTCLNAETRNFKNKEIVLRSGEKVEHIGIILEGAAHIIKEDIDGRYEIINIVEKGNFFAESICCAGVEESPVTVMAVEDSVIMFLKFKRILQTCPSSCLFHTKLIENMLYLIAKKNLLLQDRMDLLNKKNLRTKIQYYLENLSVKQGRDNIQIPFNREEFASFLCVERSALSHELARMKKDKVLDYYKNYFKLL